MLVLDYSKSNMQQIWTRFKYLHNNLELKGFEGLYGYLADKLVREQKNGGRERK